MKQNMTKYEAEQLLGLTGTYVYKDTVKAYRKKVKTCHPDVGGSEEEMVKVNQAKDYMEKLFANNKNAVMSCDSAPAASASTGSTRSAGSTYNAGTASRTYHASNTRDYESEFNKNSFARESEYWRACANAAKAAGDKAAYTQFTYFANNMAYTESKQAEAAAAAAATTASATASRAAGTTAPQASYPPPTGEPVNMGYDQQYAQQYGQAYDQFVDVASDVIANMFSGKPKRKSKYATPEDAVNVERPAWYDRIDWMVQHFPWRLSLIFVAMCFGFCTVFMTASTNTVDMWTALLLTAAVFLPLINLVTGCITNPIRKFLRKHADEAFRKWQQKQQAQKSAQPQQ